MNKGTTGDAAAIGLPFLPFRWIMVRIYALWSVFPPSHTEHGQETGSNFRANPMVLFN